MRAIRFARYGDADVLSLDHVTMPDVGPTEVRIAVTVAGLNPVDFLVRQGLRRAHFSLDLPSGYGSDYSGVVVEAGPQVRGLAVGDEVFGSVTFAAAADYVVADEAQVAVKPHQLSWLAAGTLSVSAMTAYDALASQAVGEDDTVLVTAASGGVGIILCQLARLRGARVIGTASPQNHALLESVGVIPVDYAGDVVADVSRIAPSGVTVGFDHWGDDAIAQILELGVSPDRINTVATEPEPHGIKRVGRQGIRRETLEQMAALLVSETMILPAARWYPLEDVQEASRAAEKRRTGKVALVVAAQ